MSDPELPRGRNRSIYYFAHHNKTRDEAFYREFLKQCAPEHNEAGQKLDPERELQHFLTYPAPHAQWYYPGPQRTVDGGLTEGMLSIFYALTGPTSFEIRPGKFMTIPKVAGNRDHWMCMNSHKGQPDPLTPYGSSWLLERLRPAVEVFEPDFSFADSDLGIVRNLDGVDIEPQTLAWPLMIFGPKEVERIGREKLEDSPAWKVETLPYGGIWVQVWENPFDVPQKQVTTLAKYLGLEARK